jgi:hypothetical protein
VAGDLPRAGSAEKSKLKRRKKFRITFISGLPLFFLSLMR